MDLDTSLLRSFVSIVNHGSINRAAQQLNKTQPALSLQLRKLEQQLGNTLLQRSTRGVVLTPAGERLLPHARRLLALTDGITGHYASADADSAPLRIGLLEDLAGSCLPQVLADFAAHQPGLRLSVQLGLSKGLFPALAQGELDIMVCTPLPQQPAAVVADETHGCPLYWYADRYFTLPDGPLPLVLFAPPCSWRDRMLAALEQAGQPWRIVFESASLPAVQAAVRAGLGVAGLLPDTAPSDSVVCRHPRLPPLGTVPLAVYRPPGSQHPQARALAALFGRALAAIGQPVPARQA
ncbi:LysR family transcriptional regulator [Vogesella urethralis]|uniref:LysR family transcriptional regulator n=1 Tax=Vogesella urethralis TaxID=2592656 RepID=UPI00118671E2|nr:LysR family transcriptional regulator [Vogesella urethralis]